MPDSTPRILESHELTAGTAVPFHFDDVRAMAAKILQRANEQAQRLLETARKQAVQIENSAHEDGEERGYQEGHAKGLAEGHEAGARAGREEVRAATEGLAASLSAMLAALEAERAELSSQAEADLLALALAIARQVVKREVTLGNDAALRNVEAAVALTVERRDIRLALHPDDAAAVESHCPALHAAFRDLERVSVEADPAVERGGVRASTKEGEVDLRIGEQFRALERALLGTGAGSSGPADPDPAPPAGG